MPLPKENIIAELQKEILLLQGYKPAADGSTYDGGLGFITHAFPNASFPVGAVHEFHCNGVESVAATTGFIAGILSSMMQRTGVSLWISSPGSVFPPALLSFGIEPDKIIFVNLPEEKVGLWAMEEALKCSGLSAVIVEMQEISFTASRRFQLAVEESHVTGFIIRCHPKNMATACVARWMITPLPGESEDGLPGLGFPRWNVALLKVRNGKPDTWQLEWAAGRFRHVNKSASINQVQQRKIG